VGVDHDTPLFVAISIDESCLKLGRRVPLHEARARRAAASRPQPRKERHAVVEAGLTGKGVLDAILVGRVVHRHCACQAAAAAGKGLNFIVGGNILGRGVTIENLRVTYCRGLDLAAIWGQLDLRRFGPKELQLETLWQAQRSEMTLLNALSSADLENLLKRLELKTAGSKADRVRRAIDHFRENRADLTQQRCKRLAMGHTGSLPYSAGARPFPSAETRSSSRRRRRIFMG
jgi:hypothetical protein